MLGVLVTLVITTAGCTGAATIGTSLRRALPALRRLNAERRMMALDRTYLFTLIETPRHDGTPAPAPVLRPVAAAVPANPNSGGPQPIRRRARVARAPLRAAA
jgi:hypothetical protein